MIRILALAVVCIIALSACSVLQITEESPVTVFQLAPSHSHITTQVHRREGGTVEGATVIDIHDPRGIGTLEVVLTDGTELPILRLHLAALEEFTLRREGCSVNDRTVPGATVTTHGSRGSTVITGTHQRGERNGEMLDRDNAAVPAIAAFHRDGAPALTVPLDNGYFEVTLPPVFECDGPITLSVSWIDFYR